MCLFLRKQAQKSVVRSRNDEGCLTERAQEGESHIRTLSREGRGTLSSVRSASKLQIRYNVVDDPAPSRRVNQALKFLSTEYPYPSTIPRPAVKSPMPTESDHELPPLQRTVLSRRTVTTSELAAYYRSKRSPQVQYGGGVSG